MLTRGVRLDGLLAIASDSLSSTFALDEDLRVDLTVDDGGGMSSSSGIGLSSSLSALVMPLLVLLALARALRIFLELGSTCSSSSWMS